MRSSDLAPWFAAMAVAASVASSSRAGAQPVAQGFDAERFYPSAPGGGWLVMDDLNLHGDLGGAMGVLTSYARSPLRLDDGAHRLAVVSDEAITDFAFAASYDRWRLYIDFTVPLLIKGDTGVAGGYAFPQSFPQAVSVEPGPNPDVFMDLRVGADARLLGEPGGPFRLGASAQFFAVEGRSSDYDTDGTPRAMLRVLAAGDLGLFTYAAQAGVHLRPLDDGPTPGSPRGSELLFGTAAGPRLPLTPGGSTSLVIGPEVFGETALSSAFGAETTGIEGLLSARLEAPLGDGSRLRLRLGTGPGLDPHFGAPSWRLVFGLELDAEVKRR